MLLRLECTGLPTLPLTNDAGYRVASLTLGGVTTRAVAEDRVNASGTIDSTTLYGARAVSMAMRLVGDSDGETLRGITRQSLIDALNAYLHPGRRPYLFIDYEDGSPERRIRLRGDPAGVVLDLPGSAEITCGWVGPDGIVEQAALQTVTVSPVLPSLPGRSYPKQYPFHYPKVSGIGARGVENVGTEVAAPIYRIYGPCVNPGIVNPDTGDVLQFGGTALTGTVTLVAGQYIEVDVRNATALYNGDPTQPAYGAIDLTLLGAFAYLAPGANRLRFVTTSYDNGAHVDVLFRSAWT